MCEKSMPKENPGVTPMRLSFRGKAEKSCPNGLDLRFAQGDALMVLDLVFLEFVWDFDIRISDLF
jgi:hypothetical protein